MPNTTIGADAALARLVAAVEAETSPDWDCNSYHPSLWSALDVARAALASAAQPSECGNCFEGKSDLEHVCLACSGTGHVATAPKVAPAPAAVVEPVAWLHDGPQRYSVIHAKAKDLLAESEHYTIPLYAAPVPAAQRDALVALIEHYGRVEFQRYRVGPDGNSTRWDIELGHGDLTVSSVTLPAAIAAAIAACPCKEAEG